MKDYIRTTIRGGVVLCVPPKDMEELRATISRLRVYAEHTTGCDSWARPHCDCGYDELIAALEETK